MQGLLCYGHSMSSDISLLLDSILNGIHEGYGKRID